MLTKSQQFILKFEQITSKLNGNKINQLIEIIKNDTLNTLPAGLNTTEIQQYLDNALQIAKDPYLLSRLNVFKDKITAKLTQPSEAPVALNQDVQHVKDFDAFARKVFLCDNFFENRMSICNKIRNQSAAYSDYYFWNHVYHQALTDLQKFVFAVMFPRMKEWIDFVNENKLTSEQLESIELKNLERPFSRLIDRISFAKKFVAQEVVDPSPKLKRKHDDVDFLNADSEGEDYNTRQKRAKHSNEYKVVNSASKIQEIMQQKNPKLKALDEMILEKTKPMIALIGDYSESYTGLTRFRDTKDQLIYVLFFEPPVTCQNDGEKYQWGIELKNHLENFYLQQTNSRKNIHIQPVDKNSQEWIKENTSSWKKNGNTEQAIIMPANLPVGTVAIGGLTVKSFCTFVSALMAEKNNRLPNPTPTQTTFKPNWLEMLVDEAIQEESVSAMQTPLQSPPPEATTSRVDDNESIRALVAIRERAFIASALGLLQQQTAEMTVQQQVKRN